MALCANWIKLGDELGHRLQALPGCVFLAIGISLIASVLMILLLANESGGVHLKGWFFGGGTRAPFGYITSGLDTQTAPYVDVWGRTYVGDGNDGPVGIRVPDAAVVALASDGLSDCYGMADQTAMV